MVMQGLMLGDLDKAFETIDSQKANLLVRYYYAGGSCHRRARCAPIGFLRHGEVGLSAYGKKAAPGRRVLDADEKTFALHGAIYQRTSRYGVTRMIREQMRYANAANECLLMNRSSSLVAAMRSRTKRRRPGRGPGVGGREIARTL